MSDQAISEKIPVLYFNGFEVGFSNADVFIRLKMDGRDALELKTSFTTAKSLRGAVDGLVEALEATTKHTFMTQDELAAAISQRNATLQKQETKS